MTPLFDRSRPPARIAVFRALQLGDLLCAVPALRALRLAFPRAHIALIGLAGASEFRNRFDAYVDELIEFPGAAGFPEQAARPQELPAFFRRMRLRRFDAALQMHGSGGLSNLLVEQLGARGWGGFVPNVGAEIPGLRLAWPESLPEPRRYLALLHHLGVKTGDDRLEFPCTQADRRDAERLLREHSLDPARLVLMHAGARLPSRRWPLERYAEVAHALSRQGWQVALTGTGVERSMTAELRRLSRLPLADLCGATTLGSLAALVRECRLLVCNDTGISHVAAAVGASSVVVACGSDAARWAPLDRRRHIVLAADAPCRPCAFETCPIGHPCALAVTVPQVLAQAQGQLGRAAP
ncbi:ADP-heptose--LPS heptosyltransferase 2 [Achromobacter veterisilvae]|uniref:ADP-heptose--LPS heptosyltransferase 2 n=1 Tax=Achromobacter veterisilvae TaxID=2069367 RepID=A0A446CGY7_9BURK|nr:glycosyltransferase family 9 protein [Achromobacter veterisilvae]SSW67132.1 ADP-heptose--LPS heptosyltransferase 2 [Achromobacter veterisilvae]